MNILGITRNQMIEISEPSPEFEALLLRAVEAQSQPRSNEDIVEAGVEFVVDCPLGEYE